MAQAYTSQIAVLTLVALALGEDTISSRERRERIIDSLLQLPGTPLCPLGRAGGNYFLCVSGLPAFHLGRHEACWFCGLSWPRCTQPASVASR